MVLEGYPVGFPMECLEDHPQIESASRLKVRSSKEETRQVLVTIVEDPPSKIHLGIFGTFSLREYHKEPLRCSKCQWFDHHISKCRSKPRCGVCSEEHLSDICFRKIKEGSRLTSKCPNCGLGHHAWKPICEERRKRLNIPAGLKTTRSQNNHSFPWESHSWRNKPVAQFSRLPTPSVSYARAVSAAAKDSRPSPAPSLISLPPQPCHCHQQDTNHEADFLSTILQMGLLLVGRQVDHRLIKEAVTTVLHFPTSNHLAVKKPPPGLTVDNNNVCRPMSTPAITVETFPSLPPTDPPTAAPASHTMSSIKTNDSTNKASDYLS